MRKVLFGLVFLLAIWGLYRWKTAPRNVEPGAGAGGGQLVITQRTVPSSFNRIAVPQFGTELVSRLTNGYLIRVDRRTAAIEPSLATSWKLADDGMTYTMTLRDAVFSDGTPFTAADVVFTFRALYDPKVASAIASGMKIGGQPITARALDDRTVVIKFPAIYGPGLSIFDTLPIVPRHKLEAALDAGTFAAAWGTASPVTDFAGLGPFVIQESAAGQHVTFVRNAKFWGKDAAGRQLPYLDGLRIDFVPEQNAEMLRLQSGTTDLVTEQIRPEDVAALERAKAEGKIQLVDAGVSVDPMGLWFNLVPGAPAAKGRAWIQSEELRHAISLAVDRQKVVDTVFLGAADVAYSPVTRAYGVWFAPDLPHPAHDPAKAKALLQSIGLKDRNNDGVLDDPGGKPARLSVIIRKGNTTTERTIANVQEQLRAIGFTLDVVTLDMGALLDLWGKGAYDTIYYGAPFSSTDPTLNADLWLSSGSFHFWNPQQVKPATAWEKEIDALMEQLSTTTNEADRVQTFRKVQAIFGEHEPMVFFAAPKVTIAMSARVTGASPAVLQPQVLWKPETLAVKK
jgi:peptide/nickel transport system substrate-binding protein